MAHVIVVGAGAVGSHVTEHLARAAGVTRVTIVDRDRYDASNLHSQRIDPRDVGKSKALVQARRVRRINPWLAVTAIHGAVEDLPLGALRADVLLGCLDSRRARLVVNQAAWRLGVPWIDAGVDGPGLIARAQVFAPGPAAPCLECAWGESDYAAVEQTYPCEAVARSSPTGASSALAALAAGLQAIECGKVLAGDTAHALIGRDVMLEARHHRHYVTAFRRNGSCRMPDHDGWLIHPLAASVSSATLGEMFAIGRALRDAGDRLTLCVAGQVFALAVRCPACGTSRATFVLARRLRRAAVFCPLCRRECQPAGFDLHEAVAAGDVPRDALDAPLSRVGLRQGDVCVLTTPSAAAHYQLGGNS